MIQWLALGSDCLTEIRLKVTWCWGCPPQPAFSLWMFQFLLLSQGWHLILSTYFQLEKLEFKKRWIYIFTQLRVFPTSSLLYSHCWHLHCLIIFVGSIHAPELRSLSLFRVNPDNNQRVRRFCFYFNILGKWDRWLECMLENNTIKTSRCLNPGSMLLITPLLLI